MLARHFCFVAIHCCASYNSDFPCLQPSVFVLVSVSVCAYRKCVCLFCELRHHSPIIPISYSCLALLPNLPDLPQINLSAVIKSYLVLSPTFTLTYTRTHAHTQVSTFHAGLFLPWGLLRLRRSVPVFSRICSHPGRNAYCPPLSTATSISNIPSSVREDRKYTLEGISCSEGSTFKF